MKTIRINAAHFHKTDYIDLRFGKNGIFLTTCTDNCGNEFYIPYEVIKNEKKD